MNFNWVSLITLFQNYFRIRRLQSFVYAYPDLEELSVLDVGGNYRVWELIKKYYHKSPKQLLLLNNASWEEYKDYDHVLGDACNLEYESNSFDVVFSNSVIEHVGEQENRLKFSQECQRVGKEIYIQTPNYWFPIEPHIVSLFVHWLPKNVYKKLSFLSVYYLFRIINSKNSQKGNTQETLAYRIDTTNLLKKQEFKQLFPTASITSEYFFGMEKSFIASTRNIVLK